jgi:NADPH2:quinone reductase
MGTGEQVVAVLNWGGFAEHAVADKEDVLAIPVSISFSAAAAIRIKYSTAHMALVDKARIQKGESLIVCGASGRAAWPRSMWVKPSAHM